MGDLNQYPTEELVLAGSIFVRGIFYHPEVCFCFEPKKVVYKTNKTRNY